MKSCLSDSLSRVTLRAGIALLLVSAAVRAQQAPPPPAVSPPLAPSLVLPSTHAREPEPEPDAIKVRVDGEYELRQSFLTALPLRSFGVRPTHLEQTSRLYHWLRVRPLALFFSGWELRAEADLPRGMIFGGEPDGLSNTGSDFERQQPVQAQLRVLRLTARSGWGEVTVGHTTARYGMGLVDDDGDAPRWFGTPERADTYERLELLSGTASSTLRVGVSGDLAFEEQRLALLDGDRKWRVGLLTRYAPNRRAHFELLARYEALAARGNRGGARSFLVDATGGVRSPVRGHDAELFADYEAAYRLGDVSEVTAFTGGTGQNGIAELGFAAAAGFALHREDNHERYAHFVARLEWGMATGDADPTDDDAHRFVMNPNHGVGLLLFSEILRFKTARAEGLMVEREQAAGGARVAGLGTRGGVAGASYLNPVVIVRPTPDLALKVGGVVASATTNVVDPSAGAPGGERRNFDGGSARGRSLGSELDVGAELRVHLDPPLEVRISVEAGVAFPGSAFDDETGRKLGTQAITTAGLGLTF
jgi:hypothetical protein